MDLGFASEKLKIGELYSRDSLAKQFHDVPKLYFHDLRANHPKFKNGSALCENCNLQEAQKVA